MDSEIKYRLRQLLIKHEEYCEKPYVDTVGKITIGVGYNLSDRGLPRSWIDNQLDEDIAFHYNFLQENYSFFADLNAVRQIALVDMCFNLGTKRFQSFKKMLRYLQLHNYVEAANQMLDSLWARQVGQRAIELADMMRSGM